MIARHALITACWALCACGLTLAGGPAGTLRKRMRDEPADQVQATSSISVTTHAFRNGSSVFGVRLLTAYDQGFAIRSGALHGGYDWRIVPGRLVLEPGIELGAGRPAARSLGGAGSYAGAAINLRLRGFGVDDSEPAFNVYATAAELVLGTRIGGWMPPEAAMSHPLVWEWAIEIGVHLAVGSDVVTSAQGEIADVEGHERDEDEP